MKQSIFFAIILLCCLLGTTVPQAFAQLEIHPRLSLEEEYNDNLFLSDENSVDDWITTVEPGLELVYGSSLVDVTLDYSLRYRHYQDNNDQNDDQFKDIQRADGNALFFAERPFTLLLAGTISRETVDERDNNTDYNELVNKTTVYRFQLAPQYRLKLSQTFSLVFGYSYDKTDYVSSLGNDSDEHSGRFSLVKQLTAHTEISASYNYKRFQSEDIEDFNQQDITFAVVQQIGSRLSGTVEAGYSIIEYDDGLDSTDYNWLVDLSYRLSEPITVSVGYEQSYPVSVTLGATKKREGYLLAAYQKNELSANAEIYGNKVNYLRTARRDQAYGARFDLNIPFSSAFSSKFNIGYEFANYDPDNEDVERFDAGASLGYDYRRFNVSLGYRYRCNDSDINANDYQNNVVTLIASVRF